MESKQTKLMTCTMLNGSGDLTLSWSPDEHEAMLEFVQTKLDDGYVFFEVERNKRFFGLIETSRKRFIKDAKAIKGREVLMKDVHDREAAKALSEGIAAVSKTPTQEEAIQTVKPLRKAEEIVNSNTVMLAPVFGG
ncbi:conserved hypothetical protein [Vibrio chagasii]|nr:conserved hypothetical protein [Vibrio chagasii]